MWEAVACPSLKPLAAWIEDLTQRISFIQGWIDDGTPPSRGSPASSSRRPSSRDAAELCAQVHGVDRHGVVRLHRDGRRWDHRREPPDGCYIHGLYLEGAAWDAAGCALMEARPKELYVSFPPLWLNPKTDRAPPTEGVYSCPVYKTLTRAGTLSTTGHSTNFVLNVELPSKEPCSGPFSKYCETFSAHWIEERRALLRAQLLSEGRW